MLFSVKQGLLDHPNFNRMHVQRNTKVQDMVDDAVRNAKLVRLKVKQN